PPAHAPASGAGRAAVPGHRTRRCHGGGRPDPAPPRGVRRQRRSRRPGGRGDPAGGADPGRGGRLRCDDLRPPLPARAVVEGGDGRTGGRTWSAHRPGGLPPARSGAALRPWRLRRPAYSCDSTGSQPITRAAARCQAFDSGSSSQTTGGSAASSCQRSRPSSRLNRYEVWAEVFTAYRASSSAAAAGGSNIRPISVLSLTERGARLNEPRKPWLPSTTEAFVGGRAP